jgi:hypothetical protein
MDSCQSIRLNRSSLPKSRSQAAWKTPLRVQSRCRLQQVAGEGYRSGKSFHRLPDVRIQRIPSRHARDDTRGRPPNAEAGGLANKSAIRSHWASERNAGGAVLDPVRFDRRRGGHRNRVIIMSVTPFTNRSMQLACQSCSVIRTVLKLPHVIEPTDKRAIVNQVEDFPTATLGVTLFSIATVVRGTHQLHLLRLGSYTLRIAVVAANHKPRYYEVHITLDGQ